MKKEDLILAGFITLLTAGVFAVIAFGGSGNGSASSPQAESSEPVSDSSESEETTMQKKYSQSPTTLDKSQIKDKKARIKTAKGDIVFEFFTDAPMAVSNFIFLANEGFYDGLTFHRREEGFVIQGGDPNGDGTGGPGYAFNDEKVTRDYDRGIVAMANAGPNTNGSQFFVMLANVASLPKNYTIFGKVVTGINVVDKIQIGDVMTQVTID